MTRTASKPGRSLDSSVLLRNAVKPEDVSDPISVGEYASSSLPLSAMFNTEVTSKAEHLLITLCSHSMPRLRQTHS
jgi:hypothetical protein